MLCGVERVLAALALAGLAPVLLVIALIIFVLSRRGPLVRHQRAGWKGAPLAMLKLRTMWKEERQSRMMGRFQWIEDVSGPVDDVKSRRDARVTSRFAALCRRYSIDELPQLWHVARGEMSLVGPRPVTRGELEAYYGEWTDEVLSVRPGMTGLWQIMGRSHLTYERRRRLDLILVRKASAGFYLRILLRSLPVVVSGDGAY
jgi:exopolysaccharide production protein ExoY